MGRVRYHVLVSGRVQGVYFRAATRSEATAQGVTGWVRNRPDGGVEAVFEGEEGDVEQLVNWCRTGPPGARVEQMKAIRQAHTGEFSDFQVRQGGWF